MMQNSESNRRVCCKYARIKGRRGPLRAQLVAYRTKINQYVITTVVLGIRGKYFGRTYHFSDSFTTVLSSRMDALFRCPKFAVVHARTRPKYIPVGTREDVVSDSRPLQAAAEGRVVCTVASVNDKQMK